MRDTKGDFSESRVFTTRGLCTRAEMLLRMLYSELLTLALGYMDAASDLENPGKGVHQTGRGMCQTGRSGLWEPELMNESLQRRVGVLEEGSWQPWL